MSVRLILDTSALVAYLAADTRAVELGELIANVEENGDTCGVPALCVISAYQQAPPHLRRTLLELTGGEDGPTVVLPVLAGDVGHLGDLVATLPYDLAHAASAAAQHDALLGTYRRADYGDAVAKDEILDL
ncbi:MAG: hypothetical protein HOV79_29125 [Hamadaea sp.]|nr:hypothetical protein [Hamadaea sp.]